MTSEARTPLTEDQLRTALERHDFQVAAAARELGITRQGFYLALDRLELEITSVKELRRKTALA
jgi:transcriptional regulator with GAF, ATPase, and Fis domain